MRHAHLRAFHQVALSGGFSRAADVLHVSQPALSDQVRRLEQAHDVLLFHRDRRQITLTPAGDALLRLTKPYFEAEAQIAAHLTEARAAPHGTLRVMADSARHVTPALSRFRAQHPDVFVELTTGNSDAVLSALRNYDVEVGVVGRTDPGPDLDKIDLGTSPIVAVCARDMRPAPPAPMALQDLAHWPLIFREKGSRTRAALAEAARIKGVQLSPAMEVEGREAMRDVVAMGAGIGFISEAELGQDSRLVALPLSDADLQMPEVIVTLRMRRDVPVVRAFCAAALGATGARPKA